MTAETPPTSLDRASLEDPLYYLKNLQSVVRWVDSYHGDLLTADEAQTFQQLLQLSTPAQALFARMMIRKGELFRSDKLEYDEIPQRAQALDELSDCGFIDYQPHIDAEEVHKHCRRDELLDMLQAAERPVPKSSKKSELLTTLQSLPISDSPAPLTQWWPDAPFTLIALRHMETFDRLRLMFFGNLHQDWSEFVLTELGHQSYEKVAFNSQSRAFESRADVDNYLALHRCITLLFEETPATEILPLVPTALSNPWLEFRRQRLSFQLGQYAERTGEIALATDLYTENTLDEAKVRLYRVLEKSDRDPHEVLRDLEQDLGNITRPETRLHLGRVQRRLNRKIGLKAKPVRKPKLPTIELNLCNTGERVEFSTLAALTNDGTLRGFYTENWLFTGLFGLLFWPVLFEPLPGAFFHPFQAGPADLYRADFLRRREVQINAQLATLDTGGYTGLIKQCWQSKHGTACSLVHWPALSEELIDLALAIIPAQHLKVIFRHLLSDLRNHRRGMPDLSVFDLAQQSYRLIEVKGPGDKLQDHQTLWIETMLDNGIPIEVAQVQWRTT